MIDSCRSLLDAADALYAVASQFIGGGGDVEHQFVEGEVGGAVHEHEADVVGELDAVEAFVGSPGHSVIFAVVLREDVDVRQRDGIDAGMEVIFQSTVGLHNIAVMMEPTVVLRHDHVVGAARQADLLWPDFGVQEALKGQMVGPDGEGARLIPYMIGIDIGLPLHAMPDGFGMKHVIDEATIRPREDEQRVADTREALVGILVPMRQEVSPRVKRILNLPEVGVEQRAVALVPIAGDVERAAVVLHVEGGVVEIGRTGVGLVGVENLRHVIEQHQARLVGLLTGAGDGREKVEQGPTPGELLHQQHDLLEAGRHVHGIALLRVVAGNGLQEQHDEERDIDLLLDDLLVEG